MESVLRARDSADMDRLLEILESQVEESSEQWNKLRERRNQRRVEREEARVLASTSASFSLPFLLFGSLTHSLSLSRLSLTDS